MSTNNGIEQDSNGTQLFGQVADSLDHTGIPRRREFPNRFSELSDNDLRFLTNHGWTKSDISHEFDDVTTQKVFERLAGIPGIDVEKDRNPELTGTAKQLWEMDPDDWQGGRA